MAIVLEKRTLITAVMTAWLALSVGFAGIFIIEEQSHDHTGEQCPICLEIQIAQRLIEAFGRPGIRLLFVGFVRQAISFVKPRPFFCVKKPVELKVKFNC